MKFDDLKLWLQTCEQQTILFWHVMLVVMENMTSVHDHQYMLHYPIICGFMVISFKSIDLNSEIMCTCNK